MGQLELAFHRADIRYDEYLKAKNKVNLNQDFDFFEVVSVLGEKKTKRLQEQIQFIPEALKELEELGINYFCCTDEGYPEFLLNMPNPCYLLYYKGNIDLINTFSIGIIGSRRPTPYGKYVAKLFSSELARAGVTIISGFALGIDSESHKGATENKGKTIGVLGTSIDNIYPRSNKEYAKEIIKNGNLLISEFQPKTVTYPPHFVQRNRLISAISEGLLIVEAGAKSGTLTTVDHALEQGRSIFAVPGNINSKNSYGTNRLIKFGAKPVTEVEDILEEYPDFIQIRKEEEHSLQLSPDESAVYNVLKEKGVLTNEEISYFTNLNIKYIIGILSVLELKGIINDLGNNSYSLK